MRECSMKDNKELERSDIIVDHNMDVNYDTGTITVYIESWFNVDKKFGTHVLNSDNMWLNLYADYSPYDDTLKMSYQVDTDDNSKFFDYEPTVAEAQLIKDMIAEKIMEIHGQTPQEFCNDVCDNTTTMGGLT